MGWYGGQWVSGPCEDAPCCGCCGQDSGDRYDDAYASDDEYLYGWDEDGDEGDEDEDSDYWQAEDSALESSLFGDC